MVGAAHAAARKSRRTVRRLILVGLLAACAQTGAPPGGPPDDVAPKLLRIRPDTNALNVRTRDVTLLFDEVVSERPQGATGLAGLFLISPSVGEPIVGWHRNRLEVRPRGGYRDNTTYTVTMLPGLSDLDSNVDSSGVTFVFSTGPTIATGRITGTVFDWPGDKTAPRSLVEAISLPDSLHYVASSDSLGEFLMGHLPNGTYLLRALLDGNRNRQVDPRESYDTATVTLDDSLHREMYAFVRDTLGPSLTTVTIRDSLTLKLTFDHPLDTSLVISPERFTLKAEPVAARPQGDTAVAATPRAPRIVAAITQRAYDRRVADSLKLKAVQDSVRQAAEADSTRRADSARVNTRIERQTTRRPAVADTTPDSAAAPRRQARKIAIQVPSSDILLTLESPLAPSSVFRVTASEMRSLLGRVKTSDRLFRTPKATDVDTTRKGNDTTGKPIPPPDTGSVPQRSTRGSSPVRVPVENWLGTRRE
ncbi:MAG: hypothetical protein MNPFHGCM_01740 [Gemmatimonadaceae bacterium]|nr:hypothetical protein [Gemmatimonadaceae bacterium]